LKSALTFDHFASAGKVITGGKGAEPKGVCVGNGRKIALVKFIRAFKVFNGPIFEAPRKCSLEAMKAISCVPLVVGV